MSKHSKNNTSSSVFTYAQRQKLKGLYGTIQTRIGQDSVKKFSQCTICHSQVIQPNCCDHGHMFCRSCVIQYIVRQKKNLQTKNNQNQKLRLQYEKNNKEKNIEETMKKIQNFQKYDSFLKVTERQKMFQGQKRYDDYQQKLDIKTHIKPTGIYQINGEKQKYVKSSFWAIQNTPKLPQFIQKQQQKIIQCPGPGTKHKITLKKLRVIKLQNLDSIYCCWICSKQIGRQRIGAYKCGHLICIGCKSIKCQLCDQKDKWIDIQGSASSFSSHNKSEVKTYTHAFLT